MSAEQEALNGVTQAENNNSDSKTHAVMSTSNPLWQDEQFVQRLKNYLETSRRSTNEKPRHNHTTTPLPLEVQVSTTLSSTDSKIEKENVVSTDESLTTHRIPSNPVVPYKLKKKLHLTKPTKDKYPPSKPSIEDLPGNALHRSRKPNTKDKAVLRFPETDIAPWNITELKWNYDNFYQIGKPPQQPSNRLGRDKPDTVVSVGSNEMKAPPTPLAVDVPPEFNSQTVSEKGSNAEFILLNLLFFTLTGSATVFLWDLHGSFTDHHLCTVS